MRARCRRAALGSAVGGRLAARVFWPSEQQESIPASRRTTVTWMVGCIDLILQAEQDCGSRGHRRLATQVAPASVGRRSGRGSLQRSSRSTARGSCRPARGLPVIRRVLQAATRLSFQGMDAMRKLTWGALHTFAMGAYLASACSGDDSDSGRGNQSSTGSGGWGRRWVRRGRNQEWQWWLELLRHGKRLSRHWRGGSRGGGGNAGSGRAGRVGEAVLLTRLLARRVPSFRVPRMRFAEA